MKNLEDVPTPVKWIEGEVRSESSHNHIIMEYLGHQIDLSTASLHHNKKVEAILKVPRFCDAQQLRSSLGLQLYYSKFILNISSLLHPLHQLLESFSCKVIIMINVTKAFQQAKS